MHERLFTGDHEPLAHSKAVLAFVLQSWDSIEEAERLHREALEHASALVRGPAPRSRVSMNNLAMLLGTLGRDTNPRAISRIAGYSPATLPRRPPVDRDRFGESGFRDEPARTLCGCGTAFREALTMTPTPVQGGPSRVAVNLDNLATSCGCRDVPGKPSRTRREALAMGRRLYQGDHGSVALTMTNTANILLALGKTAEAESLARDAIAMVRRLFKADHASTARCLDTLANVLRVSGRWPEAEPIAREALAMRQRLFNGDHRDVAQSLHTLAQGLAGSGRLAEAKALADQALAMGRRVLVVGHPTLKEYQGAVHDLSNRHKG